MATKKDIVVIPGDGVGTEVMDAALAVLDVVQNKYNYDFTYHQALAGGIATDTVGVPLPDETLDKAKKADAILFGAVGGPKWDNHPPHLRPEQALLGLRKALGLFSNLRPIVLFSGLEDSSSLKAEVIQGVDFVVVRELTGGIYFGEKQRQKDNNGYEYASDVLLYHEHEIERIVRLAFQMAQNRKKQLTSVDKANVLESSRLWRAVVDRVKTDYPDVTVEHMLVDNCAMQLVRRPASFDVIVTENMFGDILSDEAAILTGSIGMLPSASLGEGTLGFYEPVHGSAPDIAGLGIANPTAMILSMAMMLRHSFQDEKAASDVEKAVEKVVHMGYRTQDTKVDSDKTLTTMQFAEKVASLI
ncbi:3-isopropylmalate dehydrogenase [Shimazuella alba]|uniref:3-isopropylmalate dehydrogenase n=1 Tax=Shimazuella alba TaxID=2690964 RepID=A0A6I4VXJ1_9BACL|nr:3-isopropylmalate dehydrogenase [Shimazuella alba]MXQ55401.1 3-isopropylmalate dehydrogenase [Shimazuella alba]